MKISSKINWGGALILSLNLGIASFVKADCTTPPSGIVAWWQGEGNITDIVSGNNGVSSGNISYVPGFVGQALSFDGSSSISIPYSSSVNIGPAGSGITIEGWIRPGGGGAGMPIVEWGSSSAFGVHLWVEAGFRLLANVLDTSGASHILVSTNGAVSSSGFQHVALTYDKTSGQAVLYVNGVQLVAQNIGSITPQTAYPLNLGLRAATGEKYQGLVDELSLYSRALSADEIIAVYNAGNAGKCSSPCTPPASGLVGWWPGEGNGADLIGGNTANVAAGVSYPSAEVGQGFLLDNPTNAYFVIPRRSSLNVGLGAGFTMDAWIKPSDVNGMHPIAEWNDEVAQAMGVILAVGQNPSSQGVLAVAMVDTNGANFAVVASSSGTLVPNVWQHIAMSYDRTNHLVKLFRNGAIVAQASWSGAVPQTSYNIWVGHRPETCGGGCWTDGTYLTGPLDELSLYNRALTTDEITAIYTAGSAGKCAGLLAPIVLVQPVGQTVVAAGGVNLSVNVGGTGPFAYQWRFNGTNISGATNAILALANLHANQSGNYSVRVTSLYGTTTSEAALVTVIPQNILTYNYSGSEKITTLGKEFSYGYNGVMYFVPDTTNFVFVGWAQINGKKQYWVSPVSDYLLLRIPGNQNHIYTVIGKVNTDFDANNLPHIWSYLHKGVNTSLTIGTRKTLSFPNTFACNDSHIYPDNVGNLILREAASSYTFAQRDTQLANDTYRTITDLVGAVTKNLERLGYQAQ